MGLMLRLAKLTLVALTLFVGACSVYSVPGEETVPVETQPEYTEIEQPSEQTQSVPDAIPQPATGAASANQQLLEQSSQARDRGDYEQSLALLERAQRIDPRSGRVYLELATTHDARGDERQAKIVAERGLLYCIERSVCEDLRSYSR